MTSNTPRPTRSEQREAARAKAKALREQQQKGDKRKRLFMQLGITTAILVAAGSVVGTILLSEPQSTAEPANLAQSSSFAPGGGFKVGSNLELFTPTYTPAPVDSAVPPAEISIYVDYQCPACAAFEIPNTAQIRSWVESGVATFEVHIMSFLDYKSQVYRDFSSRAANAATCVAEYSPNQYFDFHSKMFEIQPLDGSERPTNDELIQVAQQLGAGNIDTIRSCVENKEFSKWVKASTDRILGEPIPGTDYRVTGTPTVFVNGVLYQGDPSNPAAFAQFVQQVTAAGME